MDMKSPNTKVSMHMDAQTQIICRYDLCIEYHTDTFSPIIDRIVDSINMHAFRTKVSMHTREYMDMDTQRKMHL